MKIISVSAHFQCFENSCSKTAINDNVLLFYFISLNSYFEYEVDIDFILSVSEASLPDLQVK
jgi:hypothetical protein